MRALFVAFAIAFVAPIAFADDTLPCPVPAAPEVCFSPGTGCEGVTVAHIDAATRSVLVQAYSFTSAPIAAALIRAHERHVDVRVILDRSDVAGRGSKLATLVAAGVPTWIDSRHAIAHNKIIVYDGLIVQTGSFNLTNAAEHANAENAVFIVDAGVAKLYTDNWARHQAHSAVASLPQSVIAP